MVYNHTDHMVKIFMNGSTTFDKNDTNLADDSFTPDLMSHVRLGQPKEKFSQPFNGEITSVNFWSTALEDGEVKMASQCLPTSSGPDLSDWSSAGWQRGEDVLAVRLGLVTYCRCVGRIFSGDEFVFHRG